MSTTYRNLEESTTDDQGQHEPTCIPLPQVGYPGYSNGTQPIGQIPNQYRPAYRTRLALKLGVLQIFFGMMAMVCGIAILVMRVFLYFTGMGIGAGALFVAAGIFGVVSSRQKATWAIVTCMVLSIVSAVAAGVSIIASAEGIDMQYKLKYTSSTPEKVGTGIIMHIVLIVCCVLEMMVSCLQATICCRATCCMAGNMRPEIMVVYLPQPVMNSNQQFGGTSVMPHLMVPAPQGAGQQQHGHAGQNGVIANGGPLQAPSTPPEENGY